MKPNVDRWRVTLEIEWPSGEDSELPLLLDSDKIIYHIHKPLWALEPLAL